MDWNLGTKNSKELVCWSNWPGICLVFHWSGLWAPFLWVQELRTAQRKMSSWKRKAEDPVTEGESKELQRAGHLGNPMVLMWGFFSSLLTEWGGWNCVSFLGRETTFLWPIFRSYISFREGKLLTTVFSPVQMGEFSFFSRPIDLNSLKLDLPEHQIWYSPGN